MGQHRMASFTYTQLCDKMTACMGLYTHFGKDVYGLSDNYMNM